MPCHILLAWNSGDGKSGELVAHGIGLPQMIEVFGQFRIVERSAQADVIVQDVVAMLHAVVHSRLTIHAARPRDDRLRRYGHFHRRFFLQLEVIEEGVEDLGRAVELPLNRISRNVRTDQIRTVGEFGIDMRLAGKDVQYEVAELVVRKCPQQSVSIRYFATGGVHEHLGPGKTFKGFPVQHFKRGVRPGLRQWNMRGENVALRDQILHAQKGSRFSGLLKRRIAQQHFQSELRCDARNLFSDVAVTDDADGLSFERQPAMNAQMQQRGYLRADQMAGAFQMLRSRDLVWSRMVHDYLLGKRVAMNDLMAWNADATRMPYRMHAEYLQHLFLDNDLAEGRYVAGGRAVVLAIKARFTIDPSRVYAIGMSNGGMMAHRLACDASDIFAAVASVAGTDATTRCTPTRSVPVLHIHAKDDDHVLYNGGAGPGAFRDASKVMDFVSVPETVARWVKRDACVAAPQVVLKVDGASCEAYRGCAGGAAVQVCSTETGGHSWPGGGSGRRGKGAPSDALQANDVIWAFFLQHAL